MYDKNCNYAWVTRCEWLARCFALAVAVLGLTVLIGWALHIDALKSVLAGWVTMKANTALGFFLAGVALFAADRRRKFSGWSSIHLVFSATIAIVGLLTLGQYLFDADFRIYQLLFKASDEIISLAPPGRMAVASNRRLYLDRSGASLTGQPPGPHRISSCSPAW